LKKDHFLILGKCGHNNETVQLRWFSKEIVNNNLGVNSSREIWLSLSHKGIPDVYILMVI
jgi:hypothetical protein